MDHALTTVFPPIAIWMLVVAIVYAVFQFALLKDPMASIRSYGQNWAAWVLMLILGMTAVRTIGIDNGAALGEELAKSVLGLIVFPPLAFIVGCIWAIIFHYKHFRSDGKENHLGTSKEVNLERGSITQDEELNQHEQLQNPSATDAIPSTMKENDEELYLKASIEVEGDRRSPALWAKAITLAIGDEDQAKYRYILLRVKQLASEVKTPESSLEEAHDHTAHTAGKDPNSTSSVYEKSNPESQVKTCNDETGTTNNAEILKTHIPIRDFSRIKWIPQTKIIEMIRDGVYEGKMLGDEWYVSLAVTPSKSAEPKNHVSEVTSDKRST